MEEGVRGWESLLVKYRLPEEVMLNNELPSPIYKIGSLRLHVLKTCSIT